MDILRAKRTAEEEEEELEECRVDAFSEQKL